MWEKYPITDQEIQVCLVRITNEIGTVNFRGAYKRPKIIGTPEITNWRQLPVPMMAMRIDRLHNAVMAAVN